MSHTARGIQVASPARRANAKDYLAETTTMAMAPQPELDEQGIATQQPATEKESATATHRFYHHFENSNGPSDAELGVMQAVRRYSTRPPLLRERLYEMTKRAMDLVFATPLLLLLAPLLLLLGLITKLYDGGPMFFRQVRIGQGGKPFCCYKIRTMVPDADSFKWQVESLNHHAQSVTFKSAVDPRITPWGAILRKTSLDELPQLLNIVGGQMSLVGPRPAVPNEVSKYQGRDYLRLLVKPGLTCIWQVSGRGDIDFAGQVSMDLEYVRRRSTWLDTKLMLKTIPAVLSMRGAY